MEYRPLARTSPIVWLAGQILMGLTKEDTMDYYEGDDPKFGEFARQFAQLLIDGDYQQAHTMLDAALQAKYSPETLQSTYEAMLAYWDIPQADEVSYVSTDPMTDWQNRQPTDRGHAYASIDRLTGYSEAVSMIVTQEADQLAIRSLEWGRP